MDDKNARSDFIRFSVCAFAASVLVLAFYCFLAYRIVGLV
jgi:hypothetical protein